MNNYEIETDEYLKHGIKLLQSVLYGQSDRDHAIIYNHYVKPAGLVVDMGAGIGEMGALLQSMNPDVFVVNVTNCKRQIEIMRGLGRPSVYADFAQTGLDDGMADMVMFNESFGYGDCADLMKESARILKPGGCVIIKDWSVTRDLTEKLEFTGWDYFVHPLSVMIADAEKVGLRLGWLFHPSIFRSPFHPLEWSKRFEEFYKNSQMKHWHSESKCPDESLNCVSMLAKFVREEA